MASFVNNDKEDTAASAQETAGGTTSNNNNNNNEAMEERPHAVVQAPNTDLPLDWTQMGAGPQEHPAPQIRYPADVAEILPEDTEICIVGTAGQKITHMGKDFSATVNPNLTQLVLRSHLIRTMEGLEHFANLELLELYDNQVDGLRCLDNGEGMPGMTLKTLDMSYNVIREMEPVSLCPNLTVLCK